MPCCAESARTCCEARLLTRTWEGPGVTRGQCRAPRLTHYSSVRRSGNNDINHPAQWSLWSHRHRALRRSPSAPVSRQCQLCDTGFFIWVIEFYIYSPQVLTGSHQQQFYLQRWWRFYILQQVWEQTFISRVINPKYVYSVDIYFAARLCKHVGVAGDCCWVPGVICRTCDSWLWLSPGVITVTRGP